MCKVIHEKKTGGGGWQNSEVCSEALLVMERMIICSIGDDICAAEGAVRGPVDGIEELSDLISSTDTVGTSLLQADGDVSSSPETPSNPDSRLPSFVRSPSWLNATSSQLHIALNTLTPLTNHPNPKVLFAFAFFSPILLAP